MDEEMVTGREQIEEAQTTLTRLEHLSNLIKRDSAQDSTDEHVNLLDQMVSVLRNSIKDEIAQVVPPNQKHHFVPQFYLRAWGMYTSRGRYICTTFSPALLRAGL